MASFGTLVCGVIAGVILTGCSDKHDGNADAGNAGNAGTHVAGMNGAGTGAGTSGMDRDGGDGVCDDRGCWVSIATFQRESLRCEPTYEGARAQFPGDGSECISAFFACGGLNGAAYQYGFTGDNVQCYYDDDHDLVGAVRTSDHGPSTLAGEIPDTLCYAGPSCADPDGGVSDDFTQCSVNSDCAITSTGDCCGHCGEPTRDEVIAIRKDKVVEFRAPACSLPVACPDIACAPVAPRFAATCDAGTCAVVDLKLHASTECTEPTDCRVRSQECCECGAALGPGTLLAISDEADYTALVCDPEQGCGECAPIYPEEATATCNTEGRCELMDTRGAF